VRPDPDKTLGYYTALAVVIASMVGTGVFTTLGLQVAVLHDGLALLALWLVGGIAAACGALAYGELAAALPRSGGEYQYLGRIYHPVLGIAAGWVSVIVGFAAPVALAAMALGRYAATFLPLPPNWTATATIVLVSGFHAFDVRLGQRFQLLITALKLLLILLFVGAGFSVPITGDVQFGPPAATLDEIFSGDFALALIYVSYAYSGWNAAAYVAGEIENPQRVVPRALVNGTLIVTAIYLLLNLVFLRTVPLGELAGRIEVGALSAAWIFGVRGGLLMNAMLCLLLLSTVSAMVLAGPRVLQVMGEDLPSLAPLAKRTRRGAPLRAILLQQGLALAFVATGSFAGVLSYAGFTLTLFALLTVAGVPLLRYREPTLHRPYRTWGHPWTELLFIALSTVSLWFVVRERPLAAAGALVTIGVALLLSVGQGVGKARRG